MKLGIGSYSYMWSIGFHGSQPRHPLDAFMLLARAHELGVHVIQYGPNLPLDLLAATDLDVLIAQSHAWDIEIEVGTRGIEANHVLTQLQLAKAVGSSLLRSVPELADASVPSVEQLRRALESLVPYLEKASVRLALENARIPCKELARTLKLINSRWVGITLDTVNSLAIPEGTREVTETLAPFVMSLHVKDFVVERVWNAMGFRVEGRPAGQGQLDIPRLLETLLEAGVEPNAILELWPPEQASLADTVALEEDWAIKSISYLRQMIAN